MFAALYMYPRSNRQFVSSGGLGTMGYGLPAAVGSAFAKRDNNVILVTGDGSFQMTFQELALLKEYNLNVKVVIYDNNCLGMVRQWQELFYGQTKEVRQRYRCPLPGTRENDARVSSVVLSRRTDRFQCLALFRC